MKPVLALGLGAAMLAACGAHIGGGNGAGPDGAAGGDGGGSADAAVLIDSPIVPACANGRTVFLNFEGVLLTKAPASDATHDLVSWIGGTTATVPKYAAASTTRDADIAEITSLVKAQLGTYPFEVVTQRPTVGPFVMIVYGGTPATVQTQFAGAVNALDCGDTVKSDVGWVQDGLASNQVVANFTVGAIGYGLGLTGTTDTSDCMCGWNVQCAQTQSACVLHPDATSRADCPSEVEPQDENAAFATKFCE